MPGGRDPHQIAKHYSPETVWESALMLCRWLEQKEDGYWKGKTLVELGSGTGVASILLGHLGANVYSTEVREAIPLLKYNMKKNFGESETKSVHVRELDWRSKKHRMSLW